MTTETEIVLMSLTNEELEDAARWMAWCHDRWRQSRHDTEADRVDALVAAGYHGTEGPLHALRALDLAIVRERAQRGGADPWEAGMPLDDHPAANRIRLYQERIALNPDQGIKPLLDAAGVLSRFCPGCQETKALTVAFWRWEETTTNAWCRQCLEGTPRQQRAAQVAVRSALIDEDDGETAPELPVAPFTPDELVPVPASQAEVDLL